MKPSALLSSFAAALLLAPVLVSAQPQDAPPAPLNPRQAGRQLRPIGEGQAPMGRMQMGKRMQDLGLTDIQKADMKKVRETQQRERLRKSTDFKIASMDLKSLLSEEKVDEKAIAQKLAEVQAAQGALLKVRVDAALAMKRILTPEQQKKMAQMRGQRMGMRNMGQRRQMRPGHGRQGQPMGQGFHRDDSEDLNPEGPVLR